MTDDNPKGPPGFTWRGYEFPEFEMFAWYADARCGTASNQKLMCCVDAEEVERGRFTYQARTDYPTGSKYRSQRTGSPQAALDDLAERVHVVEQAKAALLGAEKQGRP